MSVVMPQRHLIEHPSEHLARGLATAVEGALWRYDPIRQTNTRIDVSADDGVVHLDGNVRSAIIKSIATRLALDVPGVVRVVNRLVADPEIERDVAMRMALDPEIEVTTDKVTVTAQSGSVVLGGRLFAATQAEADALRDRIGAMAATVPGVREVINEIEAIEGDESAFVVSADVVEADAGPKRASGPKRGGSLIPEPLKDKLRAMIVARAAARAARDA